jgi:hypothetical protein
MGDGSNIPQPALDHPLRIGVRVIAKERSAGSRKTIGNQRATSVLNSHGAQKCKRCLQIPVKIPYRGKLFNTYKGSQNGTVTAARNIGAYRLGIWAKGIFK